MTSDLAVYGPVDAAKEKYTGRIPVSIARGNLGDRLRFLSSNGLAVESLVTEFVRNACGSGDRLVHWTMNYSDGEFAMSASAQAYERIDLRTSPEVKELIVRAASTAGMSVSAFLLGSAQERARQILAEAEMVTLTSRDWNAFAKALDDTDKPRPKLSAAVKRHRDWQQGRR